MFFIVLLFSTSIFYITEKTAKPLSKFMESG